MPNYTCIVGKTYTCSCKLIRVECEISTLLHRKINIQEKSLQHFMPDIKQQIVKKNSFIKGQFNLPSEIKRLASSIIESLP